MAFKTDLLARVYDSVGIEELSQLIRGTPLTHRTLYAQGQLPLTVRDTSPRFISMLGLSPSKHCCYNLYDNILCAADDLPIPCWLSQFGRCATLGPLRTTVERKSRNQCYLAIFSRWLHLGHFSLYHVSQG